MCIQDGCLIKPTFNFKGETKLLYCNKHKLTGIVDVKHKICIHENCKIIMNHIF